MISITIPTRNEFRRFAAFSVSPLFEMAASLHALAQSHPAPRHQDWLGQASQVFQQERLDEEWNYFVPVFSETIPDILALPYLERFITIDELFEHLVHLPARLFTRSLLNSLRTENRCNKEIVYPVELDLLKDPGLVKSRFTLFVSSYWHTVFEPTLPQLTPRLYAETEKINACLHTNQLGTYLEQVSEHIIYDAHTDTISVVDPQRSGHPSIQSIVLHPSWFFDKSILISTKIDKVHIIYSIRPHQSMV